MQPFANEKSAVLPPLSSRTNVNGTAEICGERDPTASDLRLEIRRPLECSSTPALGLSGEVAERASERHGDEQQHQMNHGNRFPASGPLNTARQDSKDRAGKPAPRNPNYTPLGLNQRLALISFENPVQHPRAHSGLLLYTATSSSSDTPPVAVTRVPTEPLSHRISANARLPRAKSARLASPKSTSSSTLFSKHWIHDLAPNLLNPKKRQPSANVSSHPIKENKKPRFQKHNHLDLGQETDKMIQKEIRRIEYTKRSSGNGHDQGAAGQHEKRRKLSVQGNRSRSETDSLLKRQNAVQSPTTSPSNQGNTGSSLVQIASLPRNSPLNNIINLASLEEEIVQAKLKFRLAEKQLIQEKARYGSASREAGARVTALNTKLAALHRQRSEIGNDAQRMLAFRKDDIKVDRDRNETCNKSTPKSPSPSPLPPSPASYEICSPTRNEWKDRLTLCYEALGRSEPGHEMVNDVKSESETLSAEEGSILRQEGIHDIHLPRIDIAEDRKLAMPPQRRVQFALTDVETFL